MKYIFVIVLLAFVGCSNKSMIGYMTESKSNPETGLFETIEYSPYYEFEFRTEDKSILARLVITLGPERVPHGFKHKGRFANDLQRAYRDGIVDWVSEIYFINTSDSVLRVTPSFIKVGYDEMNFSEELNISPSSWKITKPLVALHSVYGTKSKVEFGFNYNGKEYKVLGEAKRKSVSEISEKYSN